MDVGVASDDARVGDSADVRDGDDFDVWVGARASSLLRFAYLMTGSQEAAEESVQTALTTACEKWSRVRRMDDRDAYVRRMVVNAHISRWRTFRRREVPVALVQPGHAGASGPDVARGVTEADRVWRLRASLPPSQRASVVLRFYEDLSYREIAVTLGCREATVRSHVHRALATLRATIEQENSHE